MINKKPRLLDLFCCAGGASVGYARAGFEVVGVDIKPQPHYPFEFHQADAINIMKLLIDGHAIAFEANNFQHLYTLDEIDAIHASPPCQNYSISRYMQGVKGSDELIPQIREQLLKTSKPFVIENVPLSPLEDPIKLSGMCFGLKIIRRRLFELHNFTVPEPTPCKVKNYRYEGYIPYHHGISIKRGHLPNIWTKERLQSAMDIDWMNIKEMTQAIPPTYTQYIGLYLLQVVPQKVKQEC